MKELGIYIHIPFCAKKCDYCDFVSYQNKEGYIDKYVQALKNEIVGADLASARATVKIAPAIHSQNNIHRRGNPVFYRQQIYRRNFKYN